jgi:hypothetical protein
VSAASSSGAVDEELKVSGVGRPVVDAVALGAVRRFRAFMIDGTKVWGLRS